MQQLRPSELAEWLADAGKQAPQLIDVREPWETAICSIEGSKAMPMREVGARADELDRTQPVVVICHHGLRSWRVGAWLAEQGFTGVFNLQGGVAAWADQVDPAMARY